MKSLNQVQLIGNLGKDDAEMRFTPSGKKVATFSMATSRKYKDDTGQVKEDTTWHRIVAWEHLAELANNFLDKGSSVFVQGRINNRSWEDGQGNKHYASEIVAEEIILLDKKQPAAQPAAKEVNSAAEKVEELKEVVEELPF